MTKARITETAPDVAIVGSGFAGSLVALALRRIGKSVVLLERGQHPRFAIGESSTPLANLLLEELCDRYDLGQVRALSKWGTWQRQHPTIAGGLKRGFSFFHHACAEPFRDEGDHRRQLSSPPARTTASATRIGIAPALIIFSCRRPSRQGSSISIRSN